MFINLKNSGWVSSALVITVFSASGLSGCATSPKVSENATQSQGFKAFPYLSQLLMGSDAKKQLRKARAEGLKISAPERQADLSRVHKRVHFSTKAMHISNKRVRIDADGSIFGGNNRPELDFFIRAASETINSGHNGFVIVQLDQFTPSPNLINLGSYFRSSDSTWIGNYEKFLVHRNELSPFSSRASMNRKVLQGTILMLDEAEFPLRQRFNAHEIYFNLAEARFQL